MLLKPSPWAGLLSKYLSSFKIHLLIILHFRVELYYKSHSNVIILLDNLAPALENLVIIKKKPNKDLVLGYIIKVQKPTPLFIYLSLSLVFKYNRNWRKIHHLYHLCRELVYNYILNSISKLRYTSFQDALELVIPVFRHSIIKRNVINSIKNIPIAP